MAFADTLIFPDRVKSLSGKRERKTAIAINQGDYEQRTPIVTRTRRSFDAGLKLRTPSEFALIEQFFESCDGQYLGFRLQDWLDYQVTQSNGLLWAIDASGNPLGSVGVGYGVPTYQTYKQVGNALFPKYRQIQKLFGAFTPRRNGGGITAGVAAGNYAYDANTGIVTFVADSSSTVTAVTAGATTQVTLTAALTGLVVGSRLYLSGLTGTHASLLNGLSHAITAISGGGSNVYTLSTNTAGKTITAAGSGYKYPQASDTLTWAGYFHVPCRFATDEIDWSVQTTRADGELLVACPSIPIIEVRLP